MEITPKKPVPMLEDLAADILSLLPVKSLLRFECVSKSWGSLISSSNLQKLHLHESKKTTNLIMVTLRDRIEYLDNPSLHVIRPLSFFLDKPSSTINAASRADCLRYNGSYSVIGSCNGLICLLYYANDLLYGYEAYNVQFWNPAMRLTSQISPVLTVKGCARFTKFGFGYDESSDTYKVVAVLNDLFARGELEAKELMATRVKVYTMGNGDGAHCWRDIGGFPSYPSSKQNEGMFVSGTLNWVAIKNFEFAHTLRWDVNVDQYVIVSLDMGNYAYRELSFPAFSLGDDVPSSRNFEPLIEVFDDCLCLFYDYKRSHFVMWQMKEFGVAESWTRFVKIGYEHIRRVEYLESPLIPLCISESGDVMVFLKHGFQMIVYNRKDDRVEGCFAVRNREYLIDNAKNYVQSLVLPC